MTGQIDDDVDGVAADAVGQRVVGQSDGADPMIRMATVARRHFIFDGHFGISEHLDRTLVVVRHQRLQKVPHRVLAKVRRDVADPQPALRVACIGMRPPCAAQWQADPLVVSAVGGIDFLRRLVGVVVQREQQRVLGHCGLGVDRQGVLKRVDRRVVLAHLLEHRPQVAVGQCIAGAQGDRAAVAGLCREQLTLHLLYRAEVDVSIDQLRVERQRLAVSLERGRLVARFAQ